MIDWPSFFKAWKKPISSSIKEKINKIELTPSLLNEKGISYRIMNLDYSRIEFAADARHRVCGCGSPPQMPCNEADAVKSARPKGKLCRHKIKRKAFETD